MALVGWFKKKIQENTLEIYSLLFNINNAVSKENVMKILNWITNIFFYIMWYFNINQNITISSIFEKFFFLLSGRLYVYINKKSNKKSNPNSLYFPYSLLFPLFLYFHAIAVKLLWQQLINCNEIIIFWHALVPFNLRWNGTIRISSPKFKER